MVFFPLTRYSLPALDFLVSVDGILLDNTSIIYCSYVFTSIISWGLFFVLAILLNDCNIISFCLLESTLTMVLAHESCTLDVLGDLYNILKFLLSVKLMLLTEWFLVLIGLITAVICLTGDKDTNIWSCLWKDFRIECWLGYSMYWLVCR